MQQSRRTHRVTYLSGPMTGLPDLNYPAFNQQAEILKNRGDFVYNPADWELVGPRTFVLREAFADYCEFICKSATTIHMLPGWSNSKGANIEHALATMFGLEVEGAAE